MSSPQTGLVLAIQFERRPGLPTGQNPTGSASIILPPGCSQQGQHERQSHSLLLQRSCKTINLGWARVVSVASNWFSLRRFGERLRHLGAETVQSIPTGAGQVIVAVETFVLPPLLRHLADALHLRPAAGARCRISAAGDCKRKCVSQFVGFKKMWFDFCVF